MPRAVFGKQTATLGQAQWHRSIQDTAHLQGLKAEPDQQRCCYQVVIRNLSCAGGLRYQLIQLVQHLRNEEHCVVRACLLRCTSCRGQCQKQLQLLHTHLTQADRDDCHDSQSAKGARKNCSLGLPQRQEQGDEECFVAYL